MINYNEPTAQMLGRYQPFHDGHFELFKKILEKTGQVVIMVRSCTGEKNPYPFTSICYGRDVGYAIEKISLPKATESISATEIRKKNEV